MLQSKEASVGPVTGEVHERSTGYWSMQLASLLLTFAVADPAARQVLGAGCATGSLAFARANHAAAVEIIGCDSAEPLLNQAHSIKPHPDRITLEKGDSCRLPYGNEQFDAVFCWIGTRSDYPNA